MAAFCSSISIFSFSSIRRTGYGLRPYPATTHTRKRWRLLLSSSLKNDFKYIELDCFWKTNRFVKY